MDVKIFFVKHYKEYFANTQGIFKTFGLQDFEQITDFEIPDSLYQKVVMDQHKKYNPNLAELYEAELFGETEIDGLSLDFNFGLRLNIPQGNFRVKISDFDSEQIFFDRAVSNVRLISSEIYYIHWCIEVFRDGEKVFEHVFDPAGQEILMAAHTNVIGDTLAMLPYVREFQRVHDCKISLYLPKHLRELAKNFYPEIQQVEEITQNYYATFHLTGMLGVFKVFPADVRTLPLERVGAMMLGLDNIIAAPAKFTPTSDRQIAEPYVCIAVQASGTPKCWLYPGGWDVVVDYLKSLGYRVVCIDRDKIQTNNGYTVEKPAGAEDFTGNFPLLDRANMLYHADFFIGLGSGLSWLAHYVGTPVIMIAGFSQTWHEFFTPYRVMNKFVCNGCYNEITSTFLKENFCRKYQGTERELECQKKISPRQVLNAVESLIVDKNLLTQIFSN